MTSEVAFKLPGEGHQKEIKASNVLDQKRLKQSADGRTQAE